MNWRRNQLRKGDDIEIKMTPMIDVVFLLLVYFLWTVTFQIPEFDLPYRRIEQMGSEVVDLQSPPPPEADFDDIVVRIEMTADRVSWLINDAPLQSLDDVRNRFVKIAEQNAASKIILYPGDNVPLGDVIDVYDAARAEGFDDVNFAATPAT